MLKRTRKIIATIILLLLIAGILVYLFVDQLLNKFQPRIEATLSESLSCEVTYTDANLILLPISQITIKNLSIKNCSDPGRQGLTATLPHVSLFINSLPLLKKEIDIFSLSIQDPAINLEQIVNSEDPPPPTEIAESPATDIKVRRLVITNGKLLFKSDKNEIAFPNLNLHTSFSLKDTTFTPGTTSINSPFKFDNFKDKKIEYKNLDAKFHIKQVSDSIEADSIRLNIQPSSNVEEEISFSIRNATYLQSANKLMLPEMLVSIGGQIINLSSTIEIDKPSISGTLASDSFNLSLLKKAFKIAAFPEPAAIPNISLSSKLQFYADANLQSLQSEKLLLKNIQSSSGNSKLNQIELSNLSFKRENSNIEAAAKNKISDIAINVSKDEGYRLGSADGDISFKLENNSYQIKSNQKLKGFQYFDSATKITDVNAELSNIIGKIDKSGSAVFETVLKGNSIKLDNENFKLYKAADVVSNLKISVPAKGGYSVEGPVKANGAYGKFKDLELNNVNGSTKILITGPLKKFISENVNVENNSEKLVFNSDFSMDEKAFTLNSVSGQGLGGIFSGNFIMLRDGSGTTHSTLNLKDVFAEKFLPLLGLNKSGEFKGKIRDLSTNLTFNKSQILPTLSGSGRLIIDEGSVNQLTIDSKLADLMSSIPILGSQFAIKPIEYDKETEKNKRDSYIFSPKKSRNLNLHFKVANSVISTEDLNIAGHYGNLKAKGVFHFDKGFDLRGSAVFLEETARAFAGPIKPLSHLFGSLGKIEIPFIVEGDINKPVVKADVSRLLSVSSPTRLAGQAVRGVGDVFDYGWGVISGRETPEPTPTN